MAAPAPTARRAAFAASLWQFPRRLVHPLVLTFLAAALFSYLAGDTVRAACLLAVGLALAWDRARSSAPLSSSGAGESGRGISHPVTGFPDESAGRRRAAMGRLPVPAVVAAVVYAWVVGWLQRYSWPATISVAIPCAFAVLIAWRVAADSQTEPERLTRAGIAAWAVLVAGASIWEVTALFLQPALSTDSYAHPTLSYLANPILASAPGRSVVLFLWLACGWYLARR
jgi:hypothetical protein